MLPILSEPKAPAPAPAPSNPREKEPSILTRSATPRCGDCAHMLPGSRIIDYGPVKAPTPSGMLICTALKNNPECLTARRGTQCGPSGALFTPKETKPDSGPENPIPAPAPDKPPVKAKRKHRRVNPLPEESKPAPEEPEPGTIPGVTIFKDDAEE